PRIAGSRVEARLAVVEQKAHLAGAPFVEPAREKVRPVEGADLRHSRPHESKPLAGGDDLAAQGPRQHWTRVGAPPASGQAQTNRWRPSSDRRAAQRAAQTR